MIRNLAIFSCVVFVLGLLGGGCIISSGRDACDGVSCDGHGICFELGGDADCSCDTGFVNDGPLHCVAAGAAIDMDWAFGPGARGCADAYVAEVRVELFDGADSILDATVDCSEGGAIIDPVEDGNYTLDLTGLGASGQEWYFASENVDVSGQNVDLGTVVLAPTGTGDMRFDWVFGVAELDCLVAGIDRVRVEVYDGSGNLEFEATPIPDCADLGALVTNFALGSWNLVLQGICDADLSVGYELDVNVIVAHPGENDYGTVILEDIGACP